MGSWMDLENNNGERKIVPDAETPYFKRYRKRMDNETPMPNIVLKKYSYKKDFEPPPVDTFDIPRLKINHPIQTMSLQTLKLISKDK